MNLRSSNIALLSSLAVLLCACSGKTLGDSSSSGAGSSSTSGAGALTSSGSEIKYVADCTPDKCANQAAGCVGGGTPELTCAPGPTGSCQLTATCSGPLPDAGSSVITYSGSCTPDSCVKNPADACLPGEIAEDVTCAPVKPEAIPGPGGAGTGCELKATCVQDPAFYEISYAAGCTPFSALQQDSCQNQAVSCTSGIQKDTTCAPSPYAGTGSVPAGSCELRASCDGADPGVFAITYTQDCQGMCTNQAVSCTTGSPENVTCAPRPNPGTDTRPAQGCMVTGSLPASCELRCTCSTSD